MRASNRSKEEKNRLGDQIVKLLLEMACSNIEIQSFVNVGGPRLKKIRKRIKEENGQEAVGSLYPRQPPKHAAIAEAIARIINHMANNMSYHDVQDTDVQLRVLGKNQKVTWSRLWEDYSSKWDQEKVP